MHNIRYLKLWFLILVGSVGIWMFFWWVRYIYEYEMVGSIYITEESTSGFFLFNPDVLSVLPEEPFDVGVRVENNGENLQDLQAILKYDPNMLKYQGVDFGNFPSLDKLAVDEKRGAILINSEIQGNVNKSDWFRIMFIGRQTGRANLWFDCSPELGDSDIVEEGVDKINCNTMRNKIGVVKIVNSSQTQQKAYCDKQKPSSINDLNYTLDYKNKGVRLTWSLPQELTGVNIYFGDKSGQYDYGVASIVQESNYLMKGLENGKSYYFSLRSVDDCVVSDYSNEIEVVIPDKWERIDEEVVSGIVDNENQGPWDGKESFNHYLFDNVGFLKKRTLERNDVVAMFIVLLLSVWMMIIVMKKWFILNFKY